MTNETNIIVLLERGKKVASCNNMLNDVTERVKCKVSSPLVKVFHTQPS